METDVPVRVGDTSNEALISMALPGDLRLSGKLLVTAKALRLVATPYLVLRQPFGDAAGRKSVVWRMNRQAETAATEILARFENILGTGGGR